MKELTVNELIKRLNLLKKMGYGNSAIAVPADEECNWMRIVFDEMNAGLISEEDAEFFNIPENTVVIG